MRQSMRQPALADAVLAPSFASAPPPAAYAAAAALCHMGQPFYTYRGTFCGIPSVDVVGDRSEWDALVRAIDGLAPFRPRRPSSFAHGAAIEGDAGAVEHDADVAVDGETGDAAAGAEALHEAAADTEHEADAGDDVTSDMAEEADSTGQWLSLCKTVVRDVIRWGFDAADCDADGSAAFFADVFHYGKNHVCGSGHAEMLVSGWARQLFNTDKEDIADLPRHISVVPFDNNETSRAFVQAVSLAYSDAIEDGAVWEPQYGIATFEAIADATSGRALVEVLRAHPADGAVLYQVAEALPSLENETCSEFVAADGLALITTGLQMHSKTVQTVSSVATALVAFIGYEDEAELAVLRETMQRCSGIATLVQALRVVDDDAARAKVALAIISVSRPAFLEAFAALKADETLVRAMAPAFTEADHKRAAATDEIPLLLDALRLHLAVPAVAKEVVEAIGHLANMRFVVPRGAVPLLVAALDTHVLDGAVVSAVASAVLRIVDRSGEGDAVFEESGVGTLLAALRTHSADRSVTYTLTALCDALTRDSRGLAHAFGCRDAVPLLRDVFQLHGLAAKALGSLAMPQLVEALQLAVDNDHPNLGWMLDGVATLAVVAEHQASFVDAGGIVPVVRALQLHADDELVASECVRVLDNLAVSEAYARRVVLAGGVLALEHARCVNKDDQNAVDEITRVLELCACAAPLPSADAQADISGGDRGASASRS
ncbi:MAG: DUF4419 domain-containing protein [Rhodocyclaceae bacterium]|nr:DUF4419 domain-containing protein [Rhodocyclaceae bacterium]